MASERFETDLRQYAELRTILDSVERGALRYYLEAPSQAARDKRLRYLKRTLKPVHDRVYGIAKDSPCRPPLYDCGGYCCDTPCPYY
jgi:hypothetical protein